MLAEAGYPDGFDVDLTVTDLDMEGILLTDLAQKIKDDLSQVGINVNIVSQPWAAGYGDAYRDGTLGFTVMYWGTDYNDPNVQLEFLPGGVVGKRAGWSATWIRSWQPCMKKPCLQRTMTRVSLFWRNPGCNVRAWALHYGGAGSVPYRL